MLSILQMREYSDRIVDRIVVLQTGLICLTTVLTTTGITWSFFTVSGIYRNFIWRLVVKEVVREFVHEVVQEFIPDSETSDQARTQQQQVVAASQTRLQVRLSALFEEKAYESEKKMKATLWGMVKACTAISATAWAIQAFYGKRNARS